MSQNALFQSVKGLGTPGTARKKDTVATLALLLKSVTTISW